VFEKSSFLFGVLCYGYLFLDLECSYSQDTDLRWVNSLSTKSEQNMSQCSGISGAHINIQRQQSKDHFFTVWGAQNVYDYQDLRINFFQDHNTSNFSFCVYEKVRAINKEN
jgi:hypothetical protein